MKNERVRCGCRRQAKATQKEPSNCLPNNRGAYLPGLRTCRMMAALTQRELAERIGISPGTVCDLENGRRKAYLRTVRRLSRALDVEPAELIREDH
jgi:DNA-binding XRE family transcriptional regulator